MEKYTFKEFMKKVMAIALDFAESKNANIKYSRSNEEKKEFKPDVSPLEERILYHFITDSDNYPIYTIWFVNNDDQHFMVYIGSRKIDITLPIINNLNNLQSTPIFNDDTNENLNKYEGNFEEKLKSYLKIMWDENNFLLFAILGFPFKSR